jgi:hypothetical protein
VTSLLDIEPANTHRRGDPRPTGTPFRAGLWSLTTRNDPSLDVRHHIELLLDRVEPSAKTLATLRSEGIRQDIFCYWATNNGQGGPELDASQMCRLGALGLAISFDFYSLPRHS